MKTNSVIKDYSLIILGSVLYALSTILFVFPVGLSLGGTSGISVILATFLPFSPGTFSVIINSLLIVLAFAVLGRSMATRTFVGSLLTTVFIGAFDKVIVLDQPIISSPYVSALVGAAIIAIASGIMFYVDSSSGGTDIIALIVNKFLRIKIGRALLITDVLIVIIGGLVSDITIFLSSAIGFVVKTFGIDIVIGIIKKIRHNN